MNWRFGAAFPGAAAAALDERVAMAKNGAPKRMDRRVVDDGSRLMGLSSAKAAGGDLGLVCAAVRGTCHERQDGSKKRKNASAKANVGRVMVNIMVMMVMG